MNSSEFFNIRKNLRKSQAQLARLLSVSPRAVQSFEQGWRKVPASIERQMLFLFFMKGSPKNKIKLCWERRDCDQKTRKKCPAWEYRAGHICWFINGTVCNGKVQENWNKKMQLCRQCKVFKSAFPGQVVN
jgi:putative transcriptional regulator